MNFLIVEVGRKWFAVQTDDVRQLRRVGGLLPYQECPDCVEGFIEFRGVQVPLLRIADDFGQARAPIRNSDEVVILGRDDTLVAFRVDCITDIVDLRTWQRCLSDADSKYPPYVECRRSLHGQEAIVIDVPALLNCPGLDSTLRHNEAEQGVQSYG